MECFLENLDGFPIILPISFDPSPFYNHLRLHNGTIWRWNRPILGKDSNGQPAFRIEHRCPAASPSLTDLIADTAFYIGLVHSIANSDRVFDDFTTVRDDFYRSAQEGMESQVHWIPGQKPVPMKSLSKRFFYLRQGKHSKNWTLTKRIFADTLMKCYIIEWRRGGTELGGKARPIKKVVKR